MAAKDLQLTGKDLQMTGPGSGQASGVPSVAANGRSGSESRLNAFDVIRRRWLILLMTAAASAATAFFLSEELKTVTTTAHLQLKSTPLPLADSAAVYTIPKPDAVANILMASDVLDRVAETHDLPPSRILLKALRAEPNVRTGTLELQLTLTDKELVKEALNSIGAELTVIVKEQRKALLDEHAGYVLDLQLPATDALEGARRDLIAELRNDVQTPDGQMQQAAQVQALMSRQLQLETEVQSSTRHIDRIGREIEFVVARTIQDVGRARQRVLEARRRQLEQHGKGLTAATRSFLARKALLTELDKLESSLKSEAARQLETPVAPLETESTDPVAATDKGAADQPGPIDRLNAAGESLASWQEQVLAIGESVVGDLDPVALQMIENAFQKLEDDGEQIRALVMERTELTVDRNHYSEVLVRTGQKLEEALAMSPAASKPKSKPLMEAEARVTQAEEKHAFLARRLEQIQRIRDYPESEYVVSSAATFDEATDVSSNRRKLFAFILLGCGVCLLSPVALLEFLNLRPSPGDVFSQRWNLPMLGTQTVVRSNASLKEEHEEQELPPGVRLMALRIQQSLFLPSGRVVLFSGLDHEHSPLLLIRELARCLSKREESVLVIQTQPNQLQSKTTPVRDRGSRPKQQAEADTGGAGSAQRRGGRPGVAEFLAGEYDDASALVMGTGLPGIDFLPGGSTTTAEEVMASSRLTSLIDQFREHYTIILLSGPSTSNPADLQMLAARADGIVFTVCKQSLRAVNGDAVISDLIELGAPILGFAEQASLGRQTVPFAASADKEGLTEFAAVI